MEGVCTLQTENRPARRFTLIQGGKPEGTRITDAERALSRARFDVYAAIADGTAELEFSDVAPWLRRDDAPDEVA